MKKSNKIWLSSLASLTVGAVPLLVIACKDERKDRYVFEFSSPYTAQAFLHDSSRSYGSFISTSTNHHTSVGLVRVETLNEPELQHLTLNQGGENGVVETKTYIVNPTWTRRKLSLASAVVITDKNGTVTTFDADDADVKSSAPFTENGISYFNSPSVELKSNNEKSINSSNFDEKLKTAAKLQFVVRDGVQWVDQEGKATKYEVKAKDFYYSWLRTLSVSGNFRHENGGSKQLDDEAVIALSDLSSVAFTDKEEYSNDYLFTLFGIDHSKFKEENQFIQNVNGKEAVTFEKLSNEENPKFTEFFSKTMLADYTFFPAPSQYIDESNSLDELPVYNSIGLKTELTRQIETKIKSLDKNSFVYKSGAYWYGVSLKNTLYVGPYYITPQKGQELILKKNLHYYDREFVNSKDTVNEIVNIYNNGIDTDTFVKRTFDKYKQGKLSQIAFSGLKDAQREEILQNGEKYGLRFSKAVNKTNPFYREFSHPFVKPLPAGQSVDYYGFNDAFAKLMYGATREQLKEGKNDPQTYIAGTGLIFRSLFNAAINWDEFASLATGGQGFAWLAKVADGSLIGGSDQSTAKYKTPYDAREEINSLFALKSDKSGKVEFGNSLGTELSPKENEEAVKNFSKRTDKLKSAGFETLKQELQKLFDEFDKQNPDLAGQPFKFEYGFPYVNISNAYKEAFNDIEQTFLELNPRLQLSVFFTGDKNDPKFDAFRTGGANGTELVSWSYDYDAIGSGYDGLSWGGNFIPTLTWIAANDEGDKNKLIKENYPELHKLAKAIVEHAKEGTSHEWVGSVPFADLHLVVNNFKGSRLPYTTTYHFEKKEGETHYNLKRNEQGKAVLWNVPEGKHATEAYAWTASFWLEYVSKLTNEVAVKLMAELTSFFNINFTYNIFKQRNEFGKVLIQNHFSVPDESVVGVSIYSDWKVKKV